MTNILWTNLIIGISVIKFASKLINAITRKSNGLGDRNLGSRNARSWRQSEGRNSRELDQGFFSFRLHYVIQSIINLSRRRDYSNQIVRRDTRLDPERTSEMHLKAYEYAMADTMLTRIVMQRDHPNDTWIQPYLSFLHERMDKELAVARREVAEANDTQTIHYWRRIIAFFHQELELNAQGAEVWMAAYEAEAMVMYGCGLVPLIPSSH